MPWRSPPPGVAGGFIRPAILAVGVSVVAWPELGSTAAESGLLS
jgi:hypothetical protein